MTFSTTRARQVVAATLLATAALACRARTSPSAESLTLAVQNSSDFQVNIFAIPSAPSYRVRLGSIGPLSSGRLNLPQNALGVGGLLSVVVDPIGSPGEWVSPTVSVAADTRACLRVMANVDGDLGRSTLYTQINGASCP